MLKGVLHALVHRQPSAQHRPMFYGRPPGRGAADQGVDPDSLNIDDELISLIALYGLTDDSEEVLATASLVGMQIKSLRESAGLTRREVCAQADCSEAHLLAIEIGIATESPENQLLVESLISILSTTVEARLRANDCANRTDIATERKNTVTHLMGMIKTFVTRMGDMFRRPTTGIPLMLTMTVMTGVIMWMVMH
jgi:hypothetical protein